MELIILATFNSCPGVLSAVQDMVIGALMSPAHVCWEVLLGLYSLALNPDIEMSLKYYLTVKKAVGSFSLFFKRIQFLFINNFISLLMYRAAYKRTKYALLQLSQAKKR